MFTIAKRFTFDAAHVLNGLPAGHKCGRLHGHTYTVEAEIATASLVPPGFVTDFAHLTPLRDYINDEFDHELLNDVLDVEPTAEALARHFFDWCVTMLTPDLDGATVRAVRVWETTAAWAEYRPEPA